VTSASIIATDAEQSAQPRPLGFINIAVIVIFLVLTVMLLFAAPSVLRNIFPVLAFAAAAVLYARSKPAYVSFVMWLWFLSPFLRRLVDYRTEFVATSPLLIAPVLATSIAGWALVTRTRSLARPGAIPFLGALAGVAYGTFIGLLNFPLINVAQSLANWLAPILFAFFLYEECELYTEFRRVIEKTFLYGVLVMGLYGVFQFFMLPEWDRVWIVAMKTGAFGYPLPMMVRVFSTMNATPAFSMYLMAGLLMLFSMQHSRLRIPVALLGFFNFLLTTDRASWIGFLVGLIFLAMHMGMRQRVKIFTMMIGCALLLGGISLLPPVNEILTSRFQSVTDPKHDESYNTRILGHEMAFAQLAHEPVGEGMAAMEMNHYNFGMDDKLGPHDSTILEFLFSLGYVGTFVYFAGLAVAGYRLLTDKQVRDPFTYTMMAVTLSFFAQAILNSIMLGVLGFVVWLSIAMTLAAREHGVAVLSPRARPFWQRPHEERLRAAGA